MQNFKKVFSAIFGIVLLFVLISVIVIVPYTNTEYSYFQDRNLRRELSGKIDCIILGASNAMQGIDPNILDENLKCNSYNLSGAMMPLDDKYYMLSKELKRNPVDTVVLEISYNTLTRDEKSEFAVGELPTIARLDTFFERISYMLKYVGINDWLNIYSREFITGLDYYQALLINDCVNNVNYAAKGYFFQEANNVTFTSQEAREKYNSDSVSINYSAQNVEKLNKIIGLCKDYNCRIIITVVPVSNACIWEKNNWDDFYNWLKQFALENQCELYDLNLVKERNTLFADDKHFTDRDHLGGLGAVVTTELLAQAMKNPEDWHKIIYNSYADMKKDSQYMYAVE